MAKPRIFVSSTYYDLKHIRNSLETFIESLGYDSVLFESGDIVFHHDQAIDESCYAEISSCHMLVLIIGGRYGSPISTTKKNSGSDTEKGYERYNSITRKEYETARNRDIPIFIFVEKNVLSEYQTYKDNRENQTIKYAHVDSVNIYHLLDDILSQRRNNYIKDFEKFEDISRWLKDQWAGLFADFLSRNNSETSLKDLSVQISELNGVSKVLKEYSESIMRKIQPDNFQDIIQKQSNKLKTLILNRFSDEELIRFLINNLGKKPSIEKIYLDFKNSNSLDDFMLKIGINEDEKIEILRLHNEVARKDFEHLKIRYNNNEEIH